MSATNASPVVSIMLPLSSRADPSRVDACLTSIRDQTYQQCEVLVFLTMGSPLDLIQSVSGYSDFRVIRGISTKSAARNNLASEATGKYMLFIDFDMELSPTFIEECVRTAELKGSAGVVVLVKEAPSESLVSKLRSLERSLTDSDTGAAVPIFIRGDAFRTVGGCDEEVDLLDDWVLSMKLRRAGQRIDRAEAALLMNESTNILEILRRKYARGRIMPAFLREFPDSEYMKYRERAYRSYIANWRILLKSPMRAIGLAVLKTLELTSLFLGMVFPQRPPTLIDGTQTFFDSETALRYDAKRLRNHYGRFKHQSELLALGRLIDFSSSSILEVGCGTGRLTAAIIKSGAHVVATDPSPVMLEQFTQKADLPPPIQSDGRALPFPESAFSVTCTFRVIWHLPTLADAIQMLQDLMRVSSLYVVLDISNAQRWENPALKVLSGALFAVNRRERLGHASSQHMTIRTVQKVADDMGYSIVSAIPLDVLYPIWLNVVPDFMYRVLAKPLHGLELLMARWIPPGRYMIKLQAKQQARSK